MLRSFKVPNRSIVLYTLRKDITDWLKTQRTGKTRVTAGYDKATVEFQSSLDAALFQMEWF